MRKTRARSPSRRSALYARKLICALVADGFAVFVVNPRRIKAFCDAEGLIAKTDRLDVALIARFAHKMSHDLRSPPDADLLSLKALSTRRRQLTELVAMEKTRLKQAADGKAIDSCKELVTILEEKCAATEADLTPDEGIRHVLQRSHQRIQDAANGKWRPDDCNVFLEEDDFVGGADAMAPAQRLIERSASRMRP